MGKAANLSEFDRGQIALVRRLGSSITETARLVGFSRSAVVSIHAKWINDGDTSSRLQGVDRPRVIKEKGRRRLSRLVKQNWRQTVAQLTAQYNAGPSANVSEHTVQRTLLDMGLCSRRPTRVPLLTKRHRQLRLQWAWEHRDWTMDEWKRVSWSDESRFLIHHVDGCVRVRRLPGEQLFLSYTADHSQAGGGGMMLWGTFSWAALEPVVVVEQTMKAANYPNITADQLHPYMAFVFPTGNGIFQQDNAPRHKTRIVLEWFEEHTDEFHLMSWPPNSPDLNPMEHIWDAMERKLRAQTPPCPNISTLRDLCLDIWYNLSPVMYQKFVVSMPRRVVAVLKAKGGATRY
ncbi:Transposable element Tc1 transposase [Araneus ventricosus]|uniref:Transposable element Tc1 transposase n=1 Tax=Araneus ventricosus TaxID=182803 RepID=A0A4Y2IGL6_ARAVE|nr:Transposable element Tc1 transposase [Araneus ventricosus]